MGKFDVCHRVSRQDGLLDSKCIQKLMDELKAELLYHVETRENAWTRESIELFRQNVPHAKIVEIPDGHHYCFIEQEELVYEEMRKFLRK